MRMRLPLVAILAIFCVTGSSPAGAQPSEGVADAVIIATNSVDLDRDVQVTGNVVVNLASGGPVLDGGVELNVDRVTTDGLRTANGDLKADSVKLNRFATISGTVFYNELFDQGATVGGLSTPLELPVFAQLPAFQVASVPPGAPNVIVGAGGSETLDEGSYGDINIGNGGVVTMTGGVYDVRSITIGQNASLLFEDSTDIRIEGRLAVGKNTLVGSAANAGVFASQVVLYVGGSNGGGGLLDPPLAADIGRDSSFSANVYAPAGTISIGSGTQALGGFIARDVWIKRNASVVLDSFVNRPPTADPQDVFTNGAASLEITLTGSDPDDDGLDFSITVFPDPLIGTLGTVTPVQDPGQCSITPVQCNTDGDCDAGETCILPPITAATVTYTPNDPEANAEDSFEFKVTDPGGLMDTALVGINSPGDPTDPPPPLGNVVAHNQLRETLKETAILVIMRGSAPCVGECDGVDDVSLNFLPPTSPANGVLSGFTQGSGVPQRTATVTYTPNAGFTGTDSFMFTVEGDTNGDGDTADPGETATATVTIEVEEVAPPTDPTATDVTATVEMDTEVTIPLEGTAGSGGGGQAPVGPATAGPAATSPGGGTARSSSPTAKAAASGGGFEQQARLDFGVTPDDTGNPNDCVAFDPIFITTQYEETQSIVFGTAVAFPGFSAPPVSIRSDGAITPPCRSTGEPPFATDWWAEFRVNGNEGAVNSFSAEVGFADAAGDGLVDLVAYDSVGNVVDQAFTVSGQPVQTLTVSDPDGEHSIRFVKVVSSNDPAGLSIDLLDYDDPIEVGSSGCPLTFSVVDPPDNGTLGDISQLSDSTAELLYTPNPGFVGTDLFIYRVIDCFGAFADAIVDLIIVDLNDCDDCYTITVTVDTTKGDVSSNPTGILCGSDCTEDFPLGTPVVLQARQIELFVFTNWSGECSGTNPILTVTQANDTSGNGIVECTANFQ